MLDFLIILLILGIYLGLYALGSGTSDSSSHNDWSKTQEPMEIMNWDRDREREERRGSQEKLELEIKEHSDKIWAEKEAKWDRINNGSGEKWS